MIADTAKLSRFLQDAFTLPELERFLATYCPASRAHVSFSQPRCDVVHDVVEYLGSNGLLGYEFANALLEARPNRIAEINEACVVPQPRYDTELQRLHGERLESLYLQRSIYTRSGKAVASIDGQIRELKRQYRDEPTLTPGDRLNDRYKILYPVGFGGFGTVWSAYDIVLSRELAIKVLHDHLVDDQVRFERFFRGARVMAEFNHPNIVRILDPFGVDSGYHFFTMELVVGSNLQNLVREKSLQSSEVIEAMISVGRALGHAHRSSPMVVHRDVKPSNIILDERLNPKLTDFDLVWAEDTTAGTHGFLGTFAYLAPEVFRPGHQAGPPSDVFSLAMTTLVALRREEFATFGKTPEQLVSGIDVQSNVREVLKNALHPNPAMRPSDGEAFSDALEAARSKDEASQTIKAIDTEQGSEPAISGAPKDEFDSDLEYAMLVLLHPTMWSILLVVALSTCGT